MPKRGELVSISAYYLATPLFAASDALGVAPVRIAGLAGSDLRWLYYAGAFACGLACRHFPRSAPWIGMAESSFNLLLLLVSFLVPIWSLPNAVAGGAPAEVPVTGADIANLAVVGAVLVWSFHRHQARVRSGSGGPDGF